MSILLIITAAVLILVRKFGVFQVPWVVIVALGILGLFFDTIVTALVVVACAAILLQVLGRKKVDRSWREHITRRPS